MPIRIWANADWEVANDGMASIGSVEYFIARNRLCELRPGRENRGVASWPLQIADKSWADVETFLEAYQKALEILRPKGFETIDLTLSASMAREIALRSHHRR
jgi:hypothetical protein